MSSYLLGTWDTRIDVQIDEDASLKTGTIVPDIDLKMIGTFTNQGEQHLIFLTYICYSNILYFVILFDFI